VMPKQDNWFCWNIVDPVIDPDRRGWDIRINTEAASDKPPIRPVSKNEDCKRNDHDEGYIHNDLQWWKLQSDETTATGFFRKHL
jgi:hypothetical protein